MKIIVKLSGADVVEVLDEDVGCWVEVRQYHADFQGDNVIEVEADWPGLKYEVVYPPPPKKRRKQK